MNELITIKKDKAVTSSLRVAEMFRKEHKHVLRDIKNLDCSEEFAKSNFGLSKYKDSTGKFNPMYYMTKDGFTFLVMGYRGKKAAGFKEDYIKEQGSTHADMLYMTYSKLANKYAEIGKRDNATTMQLNNLFLMEHIILNVIQNGIAAGLHYKDIYKASKERLESMRDIAFLEVTS